MKQKLKHRRICRNGPPTPQSGHALLIRLFGCLPQSFSDFDHLLPISALECCRRCERMSAARVDGRKPRKTLCYLQKCVSPALRRAFAAIPRKHQRTLAGDHAARLEMNNSRPDFPEGAPGVHFRAAATSMTSTASMFSLYRRFGRVRFMRQAIQAWESADRYIIQLDEAARSLQREIESSSPRPKDIQASLDRVSSINEKNSRPSKTNSSRH